MVDAVCDELLKGKQNIYAKDELSEDREFVYSLPLLDENWLSESEHQDIRKKMHAQCQQLKEHKHIPAFHSLAFMPPNSSCIEVVSDDEFSAVSSTHVLISKSEGRL